MGDSCKNTEDIIYSSYVPLLHRLNTVKKPTLVVQDGQATFVSMSASTLSALEGTGSGTAVVCTHAFTSLNLMLTGVA